ncbi:uncharacterized protein LOC128551290 [Mercenaria mercenaria]|uniref:uncharacterized protein LOC128551290 n=1 Tax=Mercenaria mercenaria TaxID=6596 RepID=UPI00234EBC21|nr:uncharacterized protein LOC128551290 [Mercenaria mercenaria]
MLRGTNEKKNLIYWNSELYFMIVFLVLTCVKTDVIRDITGEFQYVSTMNFKVVGETVDGASFQFALRQKIQEIYIQTMNDDSIWIEIIKPHDLRSHERRKRASTRDISAEYIIHTTEKKNETELHAIAELYKKQKCSKETNNCQVEDIGGVSMVFNSVLVLNDSAICNITRNHCDEKTSTCSSDEGKLECRCNKGYVKKNTNSLQCFDFPFLIASSIAGYSGFRASRMVLGRCAPTPRLAAFKSSAKSNETVLTRSR